MQTHTHTHTHTYKMTKHQCWQVAAVTLACLDCTYYQRLQLSTEEVSGCVALLPQSCKLVAKVADLLAARLEPFRVRAHLTQNNLRHKVWQKIRHWLHW